MLQPNVNVVRELLGFDRLIPALKCAFVAGANVPLRHIHEIETIDGSAGTSLLMPAWSDDGFYGVKIVNIYSSNRDIGLPGLHSTFVLFDSTTGKPLAMLDGDEITSRRTAAAAALGASFLARSDASKLLVVGAGRVGSLVAPAMSAVRDIMSINVWDINQSASERCVNSLINQGYNAKVATSLESAARQADIISCATLSTSPLIRSEWLSPGVHLDLIGSFTPEMTEADPKCFKSGSVWVDTGEALAKSGDLLNAIRTGDLDPVDVKGTLETLCRSEALGRANASQRTVFKAVGTALEDLAAAVLVYKELAEI